MSNILDNVGKIKKLDSKNMLGSLELLDKQVKQVWQEAEKVKIPVDYGDVKNITVLGMGGSTLGAHIIASAFGKELSVPLTITNDYHIPALVNEKTLVFVSSYSGTTEEPLAAMEEARAKGAKLLIIASGGALAEQGRVDKIPSLIFSTENNPCRSPRMGLGYSIFGQLILLSKIGLLKLSDKKIASAVEAIKKYNQRFGVRTKTKDNLAKQLAIKLGNKSVWFIASEHLVGNAHAAANQMNENAKRFAGYFSIPEINHHLMEGMLYPAGNKKNLVFIFVKSGFYDERIQKRYEITKEILKKNKIAWLSYECEEEKELPQVCEVLILSSYLSFYTAMLEGIDPTAIPFVDYFKKQLVKGR